MIRLLGLFVLSGALLVGLSCSQVQETPAAAPTPTVEPYSTPTECERITEAHSAVGAAASYFGLDAPLLYPRDVLRLDRIYNRLEAIVVELEDLSTDEGCPQSLDY